jgi:hypothetical protein
MRNRLLLTVLAALAVSTVAWAQATRPSTRPTPGADALGQLLKPTAPSEQALPPIVDKVTTDVTSGAGAVAPAAPMVSLTREGTYITNRVGRMTRTSDGQYEFTFEADARNMADPPMGLLPNQLLMQMESAITASNRDLKFRVTGLVTEYRGRNYLLLQKVVVVPDSAQQL